MDKIGSPVINITEKPTYEELEKIIEYWRNKAIDEQQLAHKRRPIYQKIGDVLNFILHKIYCLYQIKIKNNPGPFS